MTRPASYTGKLAMTLVALVLLCDVSGAAGAEKLPPLWGYGIKTCARFLSVAEGNEKGVAKMVVEYGRYEDWLTGFVSGLDLATGQDVLRGADIGAALQHIRAHCRGHPKDDFFGATMDFVRMLSSLH
jgi:hypothetical protein